MLPSAQLILLGVEAVSLGGGPVISALWKQTIKLEGILGSIWPNCLLLWKDSEIQRGLMVSTQ